MATLRGVQWYALTLLYKRTAAKVLHSVAMYSRNINNSKPAVATVHTSVPARAAAPAAVLGGCAEQSSGAL
eukprot:13933-Heterococcus_DN1.PRE.2